MSFYLICWRLPGVGGELYESDINFLTQVLDMIEYFQHSPWFLVASLYGRLTGALDLRNVSYVDLANCRFGDPT